MKRNLLFLMVVLVLLVGGTFAQLFNKSGNCPLRDTVKNCICRCQSDAQCPRSQKCCPSRCGHNSCAQPSVVNTGRDGGYKGSSDQPVYCNGVKCGVSEKCQYDRETRREKCTRT